MIAEAATVAAETAIVARCPAFSETPLATQTTSSDPTCFALVLPAENPSTKPSRQACATLAAASATAVKSGTSKSARSVQNVFIPFVTGVIATFFVIVNGARRIMEIEEKKGEVENEEI